MYSLEQFLNVLFPRLDGGFIELRAFKEGVPTTRDFYSSVAEMVGNHEAIAYLAQNLNVYFGVCPRSQRNKGDKDSVQWVWCLWTDLDGKDFKGGKAEAWERAKGFMLGPTVIVDSGHGYHLYWCLVEPVFVGDEKGRARLERYLEALRAHLNGDPQCTEVARVLRVPGTLNHKDSPATPVEIVKLNAEARFPLEVFDYYLENPGESAGGEDPAGHSDSAKTFDKPINEPGWIKELLDNLNDGNRNGSFIKIIGRFVHDGWSANDIYALLVPFAEKSGFDLGELRSEVDGACARYSAGSAGSSFDLPEGAPEPLAAFLEKDVPPVVYLVDSVVPRLGKTIVSAPSSAGKSLFVIQASLSMSSDADSVLDVFGVRSARVLYLDLEMGESALQERLRKMCTHGGFSGKSLFVKTLPALDLLDKRHRATVESWLADIKPDVVVFDPLGNAWSGKENEHDQVRALTGYFNQLILRHKTAVVLVHHWKKPTKEFKSGGHMAAGSYVWEAWADCHVTLKGEAASVTFTSEKNRNRQKFQPFLAKLNPEGLLFEYTSDYSKKHSGGTLEDLFALFCLDRVSIPELVQKASDAKKAGKPYGCSEGTVRRLIKESTIFETDKSEGKTHYLIRRRAEDAQ